MSIVRINLLLLLLALLSAAFLVRTQYQARQTFMQLEKAASNAHSLAVERETLEVEKRAESSNSKVERLASTRLNMRPSTAGAVRYVRVPQDGAQP